MMAHPRLQRGFTLIELMVTLAIAAILMAIAVPSLNTYRRNAELTSATNTLLAAINAARSEAMKRNMSAMVVPTNNGSSWNAGWVVFVDRDRSRNFNAALDTLVLTQEAMPAYINVEGTGIAAPGTPYIMFDASGYPRRSDGGFADLTLNLTRTDVTGDAQLTETRRIKITRTGRVQICRPTSSSDINCKSTQ